MTLMPEATPLRVVFFGDSIFVGQHVAIPHTWVARVCAELDQLTLPGREIVTSNRSINGNTTRMALERMPFDVQAWGVHVLIVQFGINDCNQWETDGNLPRVSPRAFASNLAEIVERGLRFGALRVILNTNHPTLRAFGDGSPSFDAVRRYSELVRQVAMEAGPSVSLADVETEIAKLAPSRQELAQLLLPDGVHLNRAGHDAYFAIMCPKILEAARAAAKEVASP